MRTLAALLCLMASAASAQRTECPPARLAPQLMTPAAGTVPREAAILVGMFASGTSAGAPVAALRRGNRLVIPLRNETIAPGLFRLIPNGTQRLAGSYAIDGIAGAPALVFSRSSRPAPPSVPALERVERYSVASGGDPRIEVRAHIGFPMPDSVAAVVSYWDGDDEPDLFVRAIPQQSSVVLYSSSSDCALPDGASPPPADGGQVRIAFVDLYGQISPLSAARPIE